MAKLDSDLRSLINYLYFEVSSTWGAMLEFLWSPDTQPDADLWVEPKPGTNEVRLKEAIKEFVIQRTGHAALASRCSWTGVIERIRRPRRVPYDSRFPQVVDAVAR